MSSQFYSIPPKKRDKPESYSARMSSMCLLKHLSREWTARKGVKVYVRTSLGDSNQTCEFYVFVATITSYLLAQLHTFLRTWIMICMYDQGVEKTEQQIQEWLKRTSTQTRNYDKIYRQIYTHTHTHIHTCTHMYTYTHTHIHTCTHTHMHTYTN